MKQITTATVTWINYRNYGTFLQAYALQQVLFKLGYENVIIDDASIIETFAKRKWKNVFGILNSQRKKLLHLLSPAYRCYKKNMWRTHMEYDAFKAKYLKVDSNTSSLSDLGKRYDIYICGSDQIWYPSEGIFNPYFYLSFTDKKKIAYAPSIGTSVYPEAYKLKVKFLLSSFNYIAVRERQGAELLASFVNKPIEVVLDPTLLLLAEDWIPLTDIDSLEAHTYILCYFLTENPIYMNFVRSYARERKLKLKIIANNPSYMKYGDERVFGGPERFLKEIRNSSVGLTDSFHATIFSIHFQRDFYTFQRFSNTSKINQNSRLINLFSKLGLTERFIKEDQLNKIGNLAKINYASVRQYLNKEREDSMQYLIKALSD